MLLFGRWRGLIVALFSIALYVRFVGGVAMVERAAVMGGFSVLARQLGHHGLSKLSFLAVLMALANPNVLWDISF